LKKNNFSFYHGFTAINKQLQVLYPHAYQSYIFNQSVSERIKKYGLNVLKGDIIKKRKTTNTNENNNNLLETDEIIDENEGEINITNEEDKIDEKNEEVNENVIDNSEKDLDKIFEENYELVNDENISKYNIYDVVLPVVGYRVKFPENEMKNIILDLLSKDGLSLDDFKYSSLFYYAVGYYRKILEKPKDVKYEIINFEKEDEDLQSDYYNINPHPKSSGNKFKALRMQFQLGQATYATMLFREVTKQDSSVSIQAKLSEIKKNN